MTIVEPTQNTTDRCPSDPVGAAVRLRPPVHDGLVERFADTDLGSDRELTRHRWVARLFASRRFQLAVAGPTTLVFFAIIVSGFVGTNDPTLNLTAITWYLWFCLVFVMLVTAGRAWCAMCPFGFIGDWFGRQAILVRFQKALHLGKPVPEWIARYGFLLSIGTFIGLTWVEEFFNVGGPGAPHDTSILITGLLGFAALFFLVFERRSYCRYICPLTALEGTIGSLGAAAGYRTKDRELCLTCTTKDCMRGGRDGNGCPWFTWPGSAESNLSCGLCAECFKACPNGNIGLYAQPPMTSVVAPHRRRFDVAVAVLALWGMVLFQQINATNGYTNVDNKLNSWLGFPHYPNPLDYLALVAALAAVTAAPAWIIGRLLARSDAAFPARGSRFMERNSRFRGFLVPLAYGLIPIVGADYFARQLPKFFTYISTAIPSIGHLIGRGSTSSSLYNTNILSGNSLVIAELIVMALGTAAAAWATWRIADRDLVAVSRGGAAVKVVSSLFAVVCGLAAAYLYVLMHAAL
jgi:NosR/NirI family nitrous oxide reductase transcriptional regulator